LERTKWARTGVLTLMFLVVLGLWHRPVLYPIKALVVFFHEISHGVAAVATGGRIERIDLDPLLGGVCYSRGGSRLVVLPAGYLGSMAWGAILLVASSRTRLNRALALSLGVFLLLITLLYVRTLFGFALGLVWGGGLVWLSLHSSATANQLLLQFLGLTSLLFAVVDIKEDLIDRSVAASDASQFSLLFGGPPQFWGALWILVALGGAVFSLRIALREDPKTPKISERQGSD